MDQGQRNFFYSRVSVAALHLAPQAEEVEAAEQASRVQRCAHHLLVEASDARIAATVARCGVDAHGLLALLQRRRVDHAFASYPRLQVEAVQVGLLSVWAKLVAEAKLALLSFLSLIHI